VTKIEKEAYAVPNMPGPGRPVLFNPDICNGCNRCVEICPMEVFIPNPGEGQTPSHTYPEECWYGGCCVEEFPGKALLHSIARYAEGALEEKRDRGTLPNVMLSATRTS